ncbi:UvrD-helicase domain-containing protein [Streptomyces sp. NPDC005438]|uniref:UvrD-helicase domain-containing protein n=1 Tax=Streptomyces sp. NPDC005438 TaxID=3156880 RepID=UPI0033A6459D
MPAPLTHPPQLRELLDIPFTTEQLDCVTAPAAPQVIVAGAGSGKTTVMAARVVWLVGTGQVDPERVLGLTFTNKAAGELADRVRRALLRAEVLDTDPADPDDTPGEPLISTYHAFAGRLIKDHGLRLGIEPTARLLADATRFQLAAAVLTSATGPFHHLTGTLAHHVEELLALDSELAEHLVTPAQLRAHDQELLDQLDQHQLSNDRLRRVPDAARARLELLGLVEEYRSRKRARDLLDFGDQIAYAATLARDVPEVGRQLREEFAVVLLDEYQDTSVAQRVLLSHLFAGPPGTGGSGHPVTAVGDPCQSIYGWRGASVANLDDFPHHFPLPDGTPAPRHTLSENRRSGGRLLHLANELAAPLRQLHQGVHPLRPAPDAEHHGRVRCALLPTHAEELDWLADHLRHLVHTGTPPGQIAVLCRTATDFAAIQASLVDREVPVEVVGLSGLIHLPEVADLLAVCEVLQDPTANASLVRLLTGPRWRIGPRDLALLGRRARLLVATGQTSADDDPGQRLADAVEGVDPAEVTSLADALDTFLDTSHGPEPGDHPDHLPFSTEARIRFAHLAAELRDLRRSLADPLMDVLHRVLSVTGLEVELAASPQALAARRRETLHSFLDVAAGFASLDGETTLLAFLGFLRTAARHDKGLDNSLPGGEDTVKVLTAHKAKGLEWDVVAVPGLVHKQFPNTRGRESWLSRPGVLPHPLRGDAATLPAVHEWTAKDRKRYDAESTEHQSVEELRLGYVAFTRPRSLLLASGHWWGPQQKRPRGPSSFLEAVRQHCERGPEFGEVEHWADPPGPDEENPALAQPARDRDWPMPLDPEALARRREAARRVLAHLGQHGPIPAPRPAPGEGPGPERDGGTEEPGPSGTAPERSAHPGAVGEPDHPPATGPEGPGHPPHGTTSEGAPEPSHHRQTPNLSDTEEGPAHPLEQAPTTEPSPWREPISEKAPVAGQPDVPDDGPAPGRATPPGGNGRLGDRDGEGEPPGPADPGEGLDPEEQRLVSSWDRDLEALAVELRTQRGAVREVPLPFALSASQLLRLAADPDGFARELARPMPRPPQPAARRGTRFHAWVESRFEELELPLLEPDELPGGDERDPVEIADERDLEQLKEAFLRTGYAHRTPYRVEAPFTLSLAGRIIRGRIDAVYRDEHGYEVIDWKTHRQQTADPLQLAIYRLAWAEQRGLEPSEVRAAFLYVRTGEVVHPHPLPGRAELEELLATDPPDPHPSEDGSPDGDHLGEEPEERLD